MIFYYLVAGIAALYLVKRAQLKTGTDAGIVTKPTSQTLLPQGVDYVVDDKGVISKVVGSVSPQPGDLIEYHNDDGSVEMMGGKPLVRDAMASGAWAAASSGDYLIRGTMQYRITK
jgi:hypothetical protein